MDGGRLSRYARAVWITRANPGAEATAARVAALGFAPLAAPLIETVPLPFALPDLAGVAALAFTSAAGVRAFAARWAGRDLPVFAVGDATAEAARAAGYRRVESADGDATALDRLLATRAPPGRVLAPGALRPAGALTRAERLAVYDVRAAPGPWPEVEAALAAGRLAAALIQSPSAARALAAPPWTSSLAGVRLLAQSHACARPLARFPDGEIAVAPRPREDALLALLGP